MNKYLWLISQNMAPMFRNAGDNCQFDTAWQTWLPNRKYWGTF